MTVRTSFDALSAAAKAHTAAPDDLAGKKALFEAALACAKEHTKQVAASRPVPSEVPTLPFGRDKGKLLTEAGTESLQWVRGVVEKSIDDEAKARWREANLDLLAAIDAELSRRGVA